MAVMNKEAVQRLKAQLKLLRRKEAQAKEKLKDALKQVSYLGKTCEDRLADAVQVIKSKIPKKEAAAYLKTAALLERQLLKSVEQKALAVAAAAAMIEKKLAVKLAHGKAHKRKASVAKKTSRKKSKSSTRSRKKRA
jgi:hypothetical protein